MIGEIKNGEEIIIGEGIATGQSIWEMHGRTIPAIAVGSKANLLKVAKVLRARYPNSPLIILADVDKESGEPEPKALEVGREIPNTKIVYPDFDGLPRDNGDLTDFNDLRSKCGRTMEQTKERVIEVKAQGDSVPVVPTQPTTIDSEFAYLLENNSEEKLIEELKSIAPGIQTGYKIGEVDLAFPGGAISIIAAPTSHGKTTALINFSLGALEKNPEKNAYFFTYEESAAPIQIAFINTWVSKKIHRISENAPPISKNNKRSIESHFRGTDEYITERALYEFQREKKAFFDELINTGRLKVFYTDMKAEKLVEAIKHIKENDPNVAMICIDYMQLLKTEKPRSSRQEELKQICHMLLTCAIETGLPLVLTAQFNRSVVAEEDLSPINIGEAGDIERIASLIVGMFNRNFHKLNRSGNTDRDGNEVKKESTIYVEILKSRSTGNGHACVMEFDGNKGLILNQTTPQKTIDLPSDQKPSLREQMLQTR